jgi:hypothetical protein
VIVLNNRAGLAPVVPFAEPAPVIPINLKDIYLLISSLNPTKDANLIVPATVKFGVTSFARTAFIDSGADGLFIHLDLVNRFNIPCFTLKSPINLVLADGKSAQQAIKYKTLPIHLDSNGHLETL